MSLGAKSVAFVIAAMLAVGLAAAPAMAKPDAKKKAGAKEYKPWIKICPKMAKGAPKLCVTRADYLDRANMVPYAPIAIEDVKGKGRSIVVTLPHMWLIPVTAVNKKTKKQKKVIARVGARWAILSGVVVKVDKNKPHMLKYVYCDKFGCTAQAKVDKKLMAEMKKGKRIFVAGKNGQKTLGLPFTLKGFGEAFDGKPADELAYKKAWQQQMASIQRQQIAAIKKRRAAQKKKKK